MTFISVIKSNSIVCDQTNRKESKCKWDSLGKSGECQLITRT